jgi:tetratricopeptide (TPR) repeat protein
VPADLALLPFTVSGQSPGLNGEDFARLVQLELEWFRRVRVTPDVAVACWSDSVPLPRREGLAVQELGARRVVSGLLLRQPTGWALRIIVRDSEPEPLHVFTVAGDSNDVFGWSRAAADSIVRRVFPQYLDYYREIRPHGAPNRQVYKYYFAGEREFQQDAFERARANYDSALALDATFVPALWRLGIVYRFLRLPFEDHLRRLLAAHQDELPEQNVALISALLEPDLRRRFAEYREIMEKYPRDGYVTFVYADELFHRGPLVGYPLDSALAQFRAAVAIEPELDQLPAFDHLFYGYQRLGNRAEALANLAHRVHLEHSGEPEGKQRGGFLQLAYDERFRPLVGAVKRFALGILADSGTMVGMNRYLRLAASFDIPETQLSLGAMLARNGLDPHARANGHRAQGLALMMLGRPVAALGQLDTAAVSWGGSDSLLERAEWRVLPGILGLPGIPTAEREWALGQLRSVAESDANGARALWALAVEAYARGDSVTANGYTVRLTQPGSIRLRQLLDALQDAAAGRPAQALERSEPLISYAGPDAVQDPFARSVLYLHRMRWQLALGDSAAAARSRLWYLNSDSGIEGWPQNAVEAGEIDGILGVYARLLQAEADRAAGDLKSACSLARRVRQLWHHAEPAFDELKRRADSAAMGCPS